MAQIISRTPYKTIGVSDSNIPFVLGDANPAITQYFKKVANSFRKYPLYNNFHIQKSRDFNFGSYRFGKESISYSSIKDSSEFLVIGLKERLKSLDKKLRGYPKKVFRRNIRLGNDVYELSIEKSKSRALIGSPSEYTFRLDAQGQRV
jgi:hypothetical protein